jgi:hypothetical protein
MNTEQIFVLLKIDCYMEKKRIAPLAAWGNKYR